MNELKELENEIDTLVNDFRKTCFIVKDNGLDKDKSVELIALGMINIKNTLTRLIETYTAKECFKEVVGFAGTNHNNRKFCDHYEERYKYLKGKLDI